MIFGAVIACVLLLSVLIEGLNNSHRLNKLEMKMQKRRYEK